jgi:hypothetical protein
MSLDKKAQPHRMRKASKRVLLGETREEEAARLEKEIAAHPVTRCEPGERGPSSSRPGWSSKPFIPLSERAVAEGIAKKLMRKAQVGEHRIFIRRQSLPLARDSSRMAKSGAIGASEQTSPFPLAIRLERAHTRSSPVRATTGTGG